MGEWNMQIKSRKEDFLLEKIKKVEKKKKKRERNDNEI